MTGPSLADLHAMRVEMTRVGLGCPAVEQSIAELLARRFKVSTSRAVWTATLAELAPLFVERDSAIYLCAFDVGAHAVVEGVTYERIS